MGLFDMTAQQRIAALERELEAWKASFTAAKTEVTWLRHQIELERERSDRYHAEAMRAAQEAPPPRPSAPEWASPEPKELDPRIEEAVRKRATDDNEAEELRAHAIRRRDVERRSTDSIVAEILGGAEIDLEMEGL